MIEVRKAVAKDFEEIYKLEEEFKHYNDSIENFAKPHKMAKFSEGSLSRNWNYSNFPIEPNVFLHYKLDKKGLKKDFLESLKEKGVVFLVLEDGNRLSGFFIGKLKSISSRGFVYNSKWTGYIENVFISKKYRGKDYFNRFLDEFFKILKRNKINYCSLHVDASNGLAINAYKKLGFKGPIQYKFVKKVV